MENLEINQNNCRICLEQPALLDWNEEIHDSYGTTTYKYCYYKYTQLDDEVADDYSQMLCETCSYDLKSFHFLIQKALESYSILQQTEIEYKIEIENQNEDAAEFETVILKKPLNDDDNDDDKNEALLEIPKNVEKERKDKKSSMKIPKDSKKDSAKKKTKNKKIKLDNHDDFPEDIEVAIDIPHPAQEEFIDIPKSSSTGKPVSHRGRKIMCAYCPRLIIAQHMKKHEQTHIKHRERAETCKICGVKLFNKAALRIHMTIHDENREKRFKCEFCEKSYYNRGGLNVHRRIHLGQLIPCPVCSKEYCRQVDLDKHKARAHSGNMEDKNYIVNKYFVECKDCGKSVVSHRWKHHSLLHSNTTQMKCTLCDKHFASKLSCHKHVRRVHKYKDKFSNVVEYYGDDVNKRTSHLMLTTKEIVKPILEEF